jgi:hypothetical protein
VSGLRQQRKFASWKINEFGADLRFDQQLDMKINVILSSKLNLNE